LRNKKQPDQIKLRAAALRIITGRYTDKDIVSSGLRFANCFGLIQYLAQYGGMKAYIGLRFIFVFSGQIRIVLRYDRQPKYSQGF